MGSEKNRPALFELNTRVFLKEKSRGNTAAGFDAISDAFLKDLRKKGMDYLWLLGVWKTGPTGREISRNNPAWQEGFKSALPSVKEEDICGSPFAIRAYQVDPELGGARGLADLRKRAKAQGLKICLDFVPNHTAIDHDWVQSKPHFYIRGTKANLAENSENFISLKTKKGQQVFAHGKDPYFPGWADTLQLNYWNKEFQKEMKEEFSRIGKMCDALRCDMAMLVLPEVFDKTWGSSSKELNGEPSGLCFWPEAIAAAKKANPNLQLIAEVYWDMEWKLISLGFDYAYDKKLFDRLAHGDGYGVRGHLAADWEFNHRMARFLENHDEPRAMETFGWEKEKAAAVLTYFAPGLMFHHEGQWIGRNIKTNIHLNRRAKEKGNKEVESFYDLLLSVLAQPEIRTGDWTLGLPQQPWPGNSTSDQIVAMFRKGEKGNIFLVLVNYSSCQSQCRLHCPFSSLEGANWNLKDLLGGPSFVRPGDEMASQGLFVDLPPWGFHFFGFEPATV